MVNDYIVNILARRIRQGEINPKTGEVMKLEDIHLESYRKAVSEQLGG